MKDVKEVKTASAAIEKLHDLTEQLKYFYLDNEGFKRDVLKKAIYIEETLHDLAVDKKIKHIKMKDTYRYLFDKENEQLKEENKRLAEELKARGEKIGELVEEVKELKDESET